MAREKRLYKDPQDVDLSLWERLEVRHTQEVALKAGAVFKDDCYVLRFLNEDYRVFPARRVIEPSHGLDFEFYLVTLNYLIRAEGGGLSGRMVTEKELPGGGLFFRGPHALKTKPIADTFGQDPEGFLSSGMRLGGVKTRFGDAGVRLLPLPWVPLGFVLWRADEEFPARVQTLFDFSIKDHLPLDCIWALVNQVVARLVRA